MIFVKKCCLLLDSLRLSFNFEIQVRNIFRMQKLSLSQNLSQKLSPQQIQFIKLLQVPTAELDTRIEEELEINPALEEGREEHDRNCNQDFLTGADS